MISASSSGSFKKTESFLHFLQTDKMFGGLPAGGRRGVDALARATPRDTGLAAHSWGYEIEHKKTNHTIWWINTDLEGGVNVAVLIQYGHGTGTGGYVPPRDYINPAMRPIFDELSDGVWREVTNG
jgi:hypothetical protein